MKELANDNCVCKLRVAATTSRTKNEMGEWEDKTGYFDVSIWGGLGRFISGNVSQGTQVVVEGRLNWREWETPEGQGRQAVDITADTCIPVPRRDGAVNRPAQPASDIPTPAAGDFVHQGAAVPAPAATAAADDEIPF